MAITISTHNGSAVRRAHNIRDRRVVDKQEHIDPDGRHETWRDFPEREAYKIFFGDAVADYNERQTRPERRIDDLWDKVHADAKQHTCYEMIATVGKKGNTVDADTAADILHRFVDGWDERNPNLAMIGAYFHADEEGAPHVHIDYVPLAHGYKRGPDTQPGLVKALGEQGLRKHPGSTPQIDWEHAENRALEEICAAHGIEVEHPQAGHGAEHVHTEQYKAERSLAETNQELYLARGDLAAVNEKLAETRQKLRMAFEDLAAVEEKLAETRQKLRMARRDFAEIEDAVESQKPVRTRINASEGEPELQSFASAVRSEQEQRQQHSETPTRRRDTGMDFDF